MRYLLFFLGLWISTTAFANQIVHINPEKEIYKTQATWYGAMNDMPFKEVLLHFENKDWEAHKSETAQAYWTVLNLDNQSENSAWRIEFSDMLLDSAFAYFQDELKEWKRVDFSSSIEQTGSIQHLFVNSEIVPQTISKVFVVVHQKSQPKYPVIIRSEEASENAIAIKNTYAGVLFILLAVILCASLGLTFFLKKGSLISLFFFLFASVFLFYGNSGFLLHKMSVIPSHYVPHSQVVFASLFISLSILYTNSFLRTSLHFPWLHKISFGMMVLAFAPIVLIALSIGNNTQIALGTLVFGLLYNLVVILASMIRKVPKSSFLLICFGLLFVVKTMLFLATLNSLFYHGVWFRISEFVLGLFTLLLPITASSFKASKGEEIAIESTNTEQKDDAEKEFYKDLVHNFRHQFIFFSLDQEYKITYISPSFTDLLGFDVASVHNQNFVEITQKVQTSEPISDILEKVFRGEPSEKMEVRLKHLKGNFRTFECTIVPVLDRYSKVYAIKGIVQDITIRKESQQILEDTLEELNASTDMLSFSFNQLNRQKTLIAANNEQISASVNYAKRIQRSILPTKEEFTSFFPYSFIFYRPKDVVSGDFYLVRKLTDGRSLLVAADCTGHGVPGALMSSVCIHLLDSVVDKLCIEQNCFANRILEDLHENLYTTLNQETTGMNDGMDLAVCIIDEERNELEYAGAKTPLVYIQDEHLNLIKGSRRSVGGEYSGSVTTYENHFVDISKSTVIYLFSDGFQDQFGGPKDRKYMAKRLREDLFKIHKLPMHQQKEVMQKIFLDWKGEGMQIDDIMLLGVRL